MDEGGTRSEFLTERSFPLNTPGFLSKSQNNKHSKDPGWSYILLRHAFHTGVRSSQPPPSRLRGDSRSNYSCVQRRHAARAWPHEHQPGRYREASNDIRAREGTADRLNPAGR